MLKYNTIFIRGNHDEEFDVEFIRNFRIHFQGQHGAMDTILAWNELSWDKKLFYTEFFATKQVDYYIDEQKRCFVHGGFNRHYPIAEQSKIQYYWDRDLFAAALSYKQMGADGADSKDGGFDRNKFKFKIKDKFKEVYVGHTPTTYWGHKTPMFAGGGNIINIDTGSGKGGLLTIMNVETKKFYQA